MKVLILGIALLAAILTGCASNDTPEAPEAAPATAREETAPGAGAGTAASTNGNASETAMETAMETGGDAMRGRHDEGPHGARG